MNRLNKIDYEIKANDFKIHLAIKTLKTYLLNRLDYKLLDLNNYLKINE